MTTLTRGRFTASTQAKIEEVLAHHNNLRKSYFWTLDNGNSQTRSREEKEKNFGVQFRYAGEVYRYVSSVRISRKNYYYKGSFFLDHHKRDVRLFSNLLRAKGR
jgi:hypothetical protein